MVKYDSTNYSFFLRIIGAHGLFLECKLAFLLIGISQNLMWKPHRDPCKDRVSVHILPPYSQFDDETLDGKISS